MRPGLWQILIVVLIVAIVFGAKKIPEIARALGRSSGEFKRGLKEGNAVAAEKVDEVKAELFGANTGDKSEAENADAKKS